ncbi:GGDEF domain-containing protein [Candidatus Mycoplasma pogonae]
MKIKRKKLFFIAAFSVALFLILLVLWLVQHFFLTEWKELETVILFILIFSLLACFFLVLFFWVKKYLKKVAEIEKGINYYIEEEVSKNGLGIINFSATGKILWISPFVKERFGTKILGNAIVDYFDFRENVREKRLLYVYKDNDNIYEVRINLDHKIIILKDLNFRFSLIKQYNEDRIVLGEIEIDNFSLLQITLAEEELFSIQNALINLFEKLSKKYNLSYRQYANSKFLLITNESTLTEFKKEQFDFFNKINSYGDIDLFNQKITVSGAFAYGTSNINELIKLTRKGLLNSQSRGGDQITVVDEEKMHSYGARTEIQPNSSRTLISAVSKRIMKRIADPTLKKVIIYGHKNMDLDALGASYALAKFFQTYNKQVFIQNISFDNTAYNFIQSHFENVDKKLFIKPQTASRLTNKNTLIFVCDTSNPQLLENPDAFDKANPDNIFIFDHHRVSVQPDYCPLLNQFIDTSASSASEIITEFLRFSRTSVKRQISSFVAQTLLNGIYMDTNQFQKSISNKTFNAAALLYEWGAKAQESVDILKISEEVSGQIRKLLSTLSEVKPGFFLAYTNDELPPDVVSIAADEILRIKDRKAAFVVARYDKKNYKLSARGIETNVQIIVESLGGGGHFSAAAVISENESLDQFITNIKQAIVSVKNESNNN